MQLDKAINSRRSVRSFKQTKKVNWRDILECLDSIKYSPFAGNNSVLKAIIISDKDKIEKISQSSQQEFISEADYAVVICSNPSRLTSAYGKRGEIYSRQQAGAAIQNFLLKITETGLSTCWIGHFVESQIKDLLKIPEEVNVEAIFPIGYEGSRSPRTKKLHSDLDNLLFFNSYGNKKMNPPKKLNV